MAAETAGKVSLQIKRVIHAPRDRVYAAWTDARLLREWFGPGNVRTRNLVVEPRVGGAFNWDVTSLDGEEMTMRGEFRELEPNRKIVFTWHWEDDEDWENRKSVVTVELSDCDGGTELRLTHEQLPGEESRDRHGEGWNSLLDSLEKFYKT